MQLITARAVHYIDAASLCEATGMESLFRDEQTFLLYLATDASLGSFEERVVTLDLRDAIVWLDESTDKLGSFCE